MTLEYLSLYLIALIIPSCSLNFLQVSSATFLSVADNLSYAQHTQHIPVHVCYSHGHDLIIVHFHFKMS